MKTITTQPSKKTVLNHRVVSTVVLMFLVTLGSLDPSGAHRTERSRGRRHQTQSLYNQKARSFRQLHPLELSSSDDNHLKHSDFGIGKKDPLQHAKKKFCKESNSEDGTSVRSGGSGKSGAGKGSTCTPSSQPSSSPSESVKPSNSPTISVVPSDVPSFEPSVGPSTAPSSFPSDAPSVSPSAVPSLSSSVSPSYEPLWNRRIGRLVLLSFDLPTVMSLSSPTFAPSKRSSLEPSLAPSFKPPFEKLRKTQAWYLYLFMCIFSLLLPPPVSSQPTSALFETISESSPMGSQWESTCLVDPPLDGGTFEEQRLVFLYDLFVPDDIDGSSVDGTVNLLEGRIHNGLVQQFLLCPVDNETNAELYIWEVNSLPMDVMLSNDECIHDASSLSVPPNSTCVVVASDLGMTAYFPSETGRRKDRLLAFTEANQQVLEASGAYLDEAMTNGDFDGGDVLQIFFRGFVMPEVVDGGVTGGTPPPVAGANAELQSEQSDSKVVAGALAIAFAVLCLIVVAVLALYRRKRTHELYLEHLGEIESVNDYDFEKEYGIDDRRTEILGDSSFDWMEHHEDHPGKKGMIGEYDFTRPVPGGLNDQHDVRKCTSAYCVICQSHEASRPIFVQSSLGPEAILKDLRHRPSIAESASKRLYSSPDTTEL